MLSKILACCFIYIFATIYILYKKVIPWYDKSNSFIKFLIVVLIMIVSFGVPVLVMYWFLRLI